GRRRVLPPRQRGEPAPGLAAGAVAGGARRTAGGVGGDLRRPDLEHPVRPGRLAALHLLRRGQRHPAAPRPRPRRRAARHMNRPPSPDRGGRTRYVSTVREIDPEFLSLPLRSLADAALQRARDLGADHADFRLERIRGRHLVLADGSVETAQETDTLGFAVRVVHNGAWGFAAGTELVPDAAAATR